MLKQLLTTSICCVMLMDAHSQIMLNQSGYSGWQPSSDTFMNVSQVNITPGANATWDISTANYSNAYIIAKQALSNAAFPQATFLTKLYYSFSNFEYGIDMCQAITAAGNIRYGELISRQAFGIGTATGNVNDSLVFVAQTVPYTSPRIQLGFPATMGSHFMSDYKFVTNFELTVTAYGLNDVPGNRTTHTVKADTVAGWGKMSVQDYNGDPTAFMDVLAVKSVVTGTDSFYLGGSPAPTPLLAAFGLTQGQVTKTYYIYYYRAGEIEPLYSERYSDASYTTKTASSTHASRLTAPTTGINDLSAARMSIYPNPLTCGNLNIVLGEQAQAHQWTYELLNAAGQQVAGDKLYPVSGKAAIGIAAGAKGIYYITLYRNNMRYASSRLLIQ